MNQDNQIEAEIQAKGKTAARVTPADVEAAIVDEVYFTAEHGYRASMQEQHQDLAAMGNNFPHSGLRLVTICVLITTNGTKLVGVNEGPVSPENFDAEMGRNMARQKAIDQLWPMLGYELRTKLQG